MSRIIGLLLCICLFNEAFSQGEIYGNAFYQPSTNRVVIRLALRNRTNSSTGQMDLTGMRFGFQYNSSAVTFAGYTSYLNFSGNTSTGLDDAEFLPEIGPDTYPNIAEIDDVLGESRTATVKTGGSKVMLMRYINRSTSNCVNTVPVNPGEIKVLIDIFFTLNNNNPAFYNLLDADHGFGDPQFIAQFLDKHNGDLTDNNKDIAVTVIRNGNIQNPYQPFNESKCLGNKVSPIVVQDDRINFINPINGILSCRFGKAVLQKTSQVKRIIWSVCNNELLEKIEIRKRVGNGSFKTLSLVDAKSIIGTAEYQFNDQNVNQSELIQYQLVLHEKDGNQIHSALLSSDDRNRSNAPAIEIYPNPAKAYVQFQLESISGSNQVRILDITGKVWMQQRTNSGLQRLNIESLPNGFYILEAMPEGTSLKSQTRFVKN
jgi:hypothetical protein